MLNFVLGTFFGGAVGFLASVMCTAAGKYSREEEELFDE